MNGNESRRNGVDPRWAPKANAALTGAEGTVMPRED